MSVPDEVRRDAITGLTDAPSSQRECDDHRMQAMTELFFYLVNQADKRVHFGFLSRKGRMSEKRLPRASKARTLLRNSVSLAVCRIANKPDLTSPSRVAREKTHGKTSPPFVTQSFPFQH
jgi:hypothetical protein